MRMFFFLFALLSSLFALISGFVYSDGWIFAGGLAGFLIINIVIKFETKDK